MAIDPKLKTELVALQTAGAELFKSFRTTKNKSGDFSFKYQGWYSKVIRVLEVIAPDRIVEFKRYYEIDPRRKSLGYGTYVIQDYFKGVGPDRFRHPNFDTQDQVFTCAINQLGIFASIVERADSILDNIRGHIFSNLQDDELAAAQDLKKISPRAAGALAGVIIESHLQGVAVRRGVKITKKNPTIAELNEALKAASIIEIPIWRKVSYLADIRNLCSHKKDKDPSIEQVDELLDGVSWLTKNVY